MNHGSNDNDYAVELGNRIRMVRKSKNMTLADVARQMGVTRSLLSQVERGITNPSVTTLRRVAQVLNIPLFNLLTENDFSTNALVKESERKTIIMPRTTLVYQLLSPDLNRKIEMVYSRIEVGCSSCEEPVSHPGEECMLMLKGTIRFEVGDEVFIVEEGDSLYFDCGQPHRLTNIGSVTAEMVSAITPPSF